MGRTSYQENPIRRVTGHSTVNVVLKQTFRPKREEFREALESSLPQALTGGTEERFDLKKELQQLGNEVDALNYEELAEKVKALAQAVAA